MHKPLSPLNYSDLYEICEEVLQLRTAFLQNIVCENPGRYFLQFYINQQTYWLVFDLSAGRPLFLSIESANPVKFKKTTPVLNFLKAHFKGLALKSVEIASKPNRILRLTFESDLKKEIIFKCFPHGQGLLIKSEDKTIIYPLGKFEKAEEFTFIEPEAKAGWKKNLEVAGAVDFSKAKEKTVNKAEKALAKIKKNISSMESKQDEFVSKTFEQIAVLQEKIKVTSGKELNLLHLEVKKLKRRINEYGQKKNLLEKKHSFLKNNPHFFKAKEDASKSLFGGTRVYINDVFQLWVGRKAQQNDELIRLASPHELWIHLRDRPSAHGIIRGPKNQQPSPDIVDFCCLVVASLTEGSKKLFLEGEKIDFILAPKKFLKKTKGMAPGAVVVEREKVRRIAFKKVEFQVLD